MTDWDFNKTGSTGQSDGLPTIPCPRCGRNIDPDRTDQSISYCPWCGYNIRVGQKKIQPTKRQYQEPERFTVYDNTDETPIGEGMLSGIVKWMIIFGLILIGVWMFGMIFMAAASTPVITNITITEKHAGNKYDGVPPIVVDEKGIVYGVANVDLWGMFRTNTTYQVRYYEDNTRAGEKMIDGAVIDGTTYTVTGWRMI